MQTLMVHFNNNGMFPESPDLYEVRIPVFIDTNEATLGAMKGKARDIVTSGFWFLQDGINYFISPQIIRYVNWK